MRGGKTKRARGHLSRGALLALLAHTHLLVPLLIAAWVYGGREEAQRAEEVDVAFQDVPLDQLPPDLPALEPPLPTPPDRLEPPKRDRKKKPKPDAPLAR